MTWIIHTFRYWYPISQVVWGPIWRACLDANSSLIKAFSPRTRIAISRILYEFSWPTILVLPVNLVFFQAPLTTKSNCHCDAKHPQGYECSCWTVVLFLTLWGRGCLVSYLECSWVPMKFTPKTYPIHNVVWGVILATLILHAPCAPSN